MRPDHTLENDFSVLQVRAGLDWNSWPAPQVTLRTIEEQLELLAVFSKQEDRHEKKEKPLCIQA